MPTTYDLSDDVPTIARDIADAKPDILDSYDSVDASDEGYDEREGDLMELVRSASSNDELVYLPEGEYEIETKIEGDRGTFGVVGDGSNQTRVYYTGTSEDVLFHSHFVDDIVLEGATFDISETTSGGHNSDVGLCVVQLANEGWFEDVVLEGARHRWQNLGSGMESVGHRMTFLIQCRNSSATAYIHDCHFPDGGTYESSVSLEGHAIGPNADPAHEGTNIWHESSCANFLDNGFYVRSSPGDNILWNCDARDNAVSQFRLGRNDTIVGGYAEATDVAGGRTGNPVVVDGGGTAEIIGLEIYGRGEDYGNDGIQVRSESNNVIIDRVSMDLDGSPRAMRLDSSTGNADVTIEDVYVYARGHSMSSVDIDNADVRANNFHVLNEDGDEVRVQSSGSLVLDGQSRSAGTYTASQLGMSSPLPLPRFTFGDAPESSYSLTVTDAETGSGISGAEVSLSNGDEWFRTTDSSGEVSISSIPDATYDREVSASDYETSTGSVTIEGDTSEEVELTPGDSSVPDSADLITQVVDYDSGDPLEGVVVTLWRS